MTERKLSATDAALRERITELSVHIPCGGIRGPFKRYRLAYPPEPVTWQSCADEDSPEKWERLAAFAKGDDRLQGVGAAITLCGG
jgi:hypothetical protein